MKREDEPREYTMEEVREIFLGHIHMMVNYWDSDPRIENQTARLEGLAFSILVALDGGASGCPGFIVAPSTHPSDKEYHRKNLENWYPQNNDAVVKCDISGCLHETFCKKGKPNGPDTSRG